MSDICLLKKKDVITKAAVNELESMFKVRPAKKYNGLFREFILKV